MSFAIKRILSLQFGATLTLIITNYVLSQSTTSNSTSGGVDEDLVTRPDTAIDFEGCFKDLALSDRDGDGVIKQNEYLNFIQVYGKRICFKTDALTLQQSATFNTLACICRAQEGTDSDCCLGDKAQIDTAGSRLPANQRTATEANYLTSVCKLTDATIDSRCPPVIDDRGEPIIPIIPQDAAAGGGGGGMSKAAMWGMIAGILAFLLLMCCCCIFVWKRRHAKHEEEEEEEGNQVDQVQSSVDADKGLATDAEQPMDRTIASSYQSNGNHNVDPEEEQNQLHNVPGSVAPMAAIAVARGATVGEDSDDEEEVRKKRGGGTLPSEEDEEIIQYRGAPPVPPIDPNLQPPRALRPIPSKDEYDDEWDQPGRDIQYPIEKDEMSAGEVDHYEPDGGVYYPTRPSKDGLDWNRNWNRSKPDEPDEVDARKHRIQSGLGEGEVWNKLDEESAHFTTKHNTGGDPMDWVFQSALSALNDTTSSKPRNSGTDSYCDDGEFA